jgi:hypothetical protein
MKNSHYIAGLGFILCTLSSATLGAPVGCDDDHVIKYLMYETFYKPRQWALTKPNYQFLADHNGDVRNFSPPTIGSVITGPVASSNGITRQFCRAQVTSSNSPYSIDRWQMEGFLVGNFNYPIKFCATGVINYTIETSAAELRVASWQCSKDVETPRNPGLEMTCSQPNVANDAGLQRLCEAYRNRNQNR